MRRESEITRKTGAIRRAGRPVAVAALAAGLTLTGVTAADAAVPTAGGGQAAAAAKGTFGPFGYGGVRLGMTLKQARATGRVVLKMRDGGACSGWDLKAHPTGRGSVGLYISKKRGVAVIAAPKGVRNPQGIKIGSTKAQLKKAYPKIKFGEFDPQVTVPGNKKAVFYFGVAHGKVEGMGLLLKTQDCVS
ncbi:hypothetical protein [Sphaerisporangium rufum]|nr:hypothetical protein [Sphaerisporangium rufum]